MAEPNLKSIFDIKPDAATETRLDAEAEADYAAGRFVPHQRVREWLLKLAGGQRVPPPEFIAYAGCLDSRRPARGLACLRLYPRFQSAGGRAMAEALFDAGESLVNFHIGAVGCADRYARAGLGASLHHPLPHWWRRCGDLACRSHLAPTDRSLMDWLSPVVSASMVSRSFSELAECCRAAW